MNTLRLLMFERHDLQRAVAVNTLLDMGCIDVLQASCGEAALSLLHLHGGVDIVLCDLQTLATDGLCFLSQAREAGLVNAVIICSSIPDELVYTVEQILRLQGLEWLGNAVRPLVAEELALLLQAYCASGRASQTGFGQPCDSGSEPDDEDILEGIDRQEFCAWFQPKFHLGSGLIQGAEVLLRWQRAQGDMLSPEAFLPAVVQLGLLDKVFFSVFEQGLRLQQFMQAGGNGFNLAFNLDTTQLECPRFVDRIRQVLNKHDAAPASLTFELTETGLLLAPGRCMASMFGLRMLGCNLSMDDFGVGYSSLERLCQLPFNEVKLDGGFIRDFKRNRSVAVIRSVLHFARSLDMQVVVEGIETVAQLRCLQGMGCQLGQGYLYARPMSEAELMTWTFSGDPSIWRAALQPAG